MFSDLPTFKPSLFYNNELDEVEFITEDTTVVTERVDEYYSVLRKMNSDKIVGFKLVCPEQYFNKLKEATKMSDCKKECKCGKTVVDSTSDERVVNNVMRHQYRVLSEGDKTYMQDIKDMGLEFHNYIHQLSNKAGGSNELDIAKQKIEEAVMWAVKHITK